MEYAPLRHGGTEEKPLLAVGFWLLAKDAPTSSEPRAKSQKPRAIFLCVSVPLWWSFAADRPEAF
jgi:hypothetical protein